MHIFLRGPAPFAILAIALVAFLPSAPALADQPAERTPHDGVPGPPPEPVPTLPSTPPLELRVLGCAWLQPHHCRLRYSITNRGKTTLTFTHSAGPFFCPSCRLASGLYGQEQPGPMVSPPPEGSRLRKSISLRPGQHVSGQATISFSTACLAEFGVSAFLPSWLCLAPDCSGLGGFTLESPLFSIPASSPR